MNSRTTSALRLVTSGTARFAALAAVALTVSLATALPAKAGFTEAFNHYVGLNYVAARAEAEPAAARGNPAAQWLMGTMYLFGKGAKENTRTARDWFEKSAKAGYPPAQAILGRMYEEGIAGNQDAAEAHLLYRFAAEQGCADAAYLLGRQYY